MAAALLAVFATSVSAGAQDGTDMQVSQPLPCEFASDLGRFLTADEIANPEGVRVVQQIIPDVMRDGMVYFEVEDLTGQQDASRWIVLQHCPSSQDMLVQPNWNEDGVRSRIWDLLVAREAYTMLEAAQILTDLGATVQVTDANLGDCACEHQQFYYGN